jgi:hypothetical protein
VSNPSAIPMSDRDVATLLMSVAHAWPIIRCSDDTCEPCLRIRRLWWDTFIRLDPHYCEIMFEDSAREAILFPPVPPFRDEA